MPCKTIGEICECLNIDMHHAEVIINQPHEPASDRESPSDNDNPIMFTVQQLQILVTIPSASLISMLLAVLCGMCLLDPAGVSEYHSTFIIMIYEITLL